MKTRARTRAETVATLPTYRSILLAVDSSDHANRATTEAVALAGLSEGPLTAVHVYAAKLHDLRFRQMEGGLPEKFREEEELERQRDVHDDLITRGLSIITDSYLDQVARGCRSAHVPFARRSLEGKNYRELTREAGSGDYDLLVMGALGLGAVAGSRLGTVCRRVARRSAIDTLVIKEPGRSIAEGPVVVAVDGSDRAYGGLLTALSLARRWGVEVHVVAAFDPYYHYVAFHRIAGVLSEEAGKVFRFQEQEKLHEEIIDSGLARIYEGHLKVAETVAREHGATVKTALLDGKPHDAVRKYLTTVRPSLLVVGKLGIHADEELDVGGTAEALLEEADCAVLLSQREHRPRVDTIADVTTSWTREAEERMERVPSFVRNMARMAILRFAQERGHTVITEKIVEDATAKLCPGHAEEAITEIVAAHDAGELGPKAAGAGALRWSDEAKALLRAVDDLAVRGNLSLRAEKKARQEGSDTVGAEHVRAFAGQPEAAAGPGRPAGSPGGEGTLEWQAAALARLARVPEGFMRDSSKGHVEAYARAQGLMEITLEVVEAGLKRARTEMEHTMRAGGPADSNGGCPFGHGGGARTDEPPVAWTDAAEQRMTQVPEGFMRDQTRRRVEAFARRNGVETVTPELIEAKYADWGSGSARQQMELAWDPEAVERVGRIPDFVRGMVVKEVERCARQRGATVVTPRELEAAMGAWQKTDGFHSEDRPDLYVPPSEPA